jgi:hypothetical protein
MLATEQWDVYSIFSVISGVVMIGMAFVPWPKISTRVIYFVVGIGYAAYGFYEASQTTGVFFFPVLIFAFPFVGVIVAVGYMLTRNRNSDRVTTTPNAIGRTRPSSSTSSRESTPVVIPVGADEFDWWQGENTKWYPPANGKSYGIPQHPSFRHGRKDPRVPSN